MSIKHLSPKSEKELGFSIQPYTISGLYYNYKRMTDNEIREKLDKIIIVKTSFSSLGWPIYFPYNEKTIKKIKANPRGVALSFDTGLLKKPIKNIYPWKQITYLVKSSSRFFLKPDIGEIFDQVYFLDWYNIVAISYDDNDYKTLDDTEGEHFLMTSMIFKKNGNNSLNVNN